MVSPQPRAQRALHRRRLVCRGPYWLIDEVAFAQCSRKIVAEGFQVWKLEVKFDRSAILTCTDGNGRLVQRKQLLYTDFLLDEISLYFANNVILLPSEY